jgi:gentisate 1,2-dioxygenase
MISEAPASREQAFHELIHANHMYGLWELASQMTPQPRPKAIAHMWTAPLIEKVVEQSAGAVPVGEERRAMQLFNPGLDGRWATTGTLVAAVQVLLPGEVARAHRHSPTALRFIMQGSGAYTKVDGERVYMEPGDLILTPSWAWHDHGNEGQEMVVWMDGLEIPLVGALDAMFFQFYDQEQVPDRRPANASQRLYGHGGLSPSWVKERKAYSPLLLYSYSQARTALEALRGEEGDPYEGVALEYTNPQDGGPVLPTIGCHIQLIRPGEHLQARRRTGGAVYYVAEGEGTTIVDGQAFEWSKGCIFVVPSWAVSEHANGSQSHDAVLFSMNDAPVLRKMDLYREEPFSDNGGHQHVTSTFSAAHA